MTGIFSFGKGTLNICAVIQFKELRCVEKSQLRLAVWSRNRTRDSNKKRRATVSVFGEPSPSVHRHSCHGRTPICAVVSLSASLHAPLSQWPELQENLKIKKSIHQSSCWTFGFREHLTGKNMKNCFVLTSKVLSKRLVEVLHKVRLFLYRQILWRQQELLWISIIYL